jgi:hypothetical protein
MLNSLHYQRVGVDFAWEQENSKPEKCSKMPQNSTRQAHAMLGGVLDFAILF